MIDSPFVGFKNVNYMVAPINCYTLVGGSAVNFVSPGIIGATIAGGGAVNLTNFFEEGAKSNFVSAIFGTIGGGQGNTNGASYATIP